jgi:hypothetical protein
MTAKKLPWHLIRRATGVIVKGITSSIRFGVVDARSFVQQGFPVHNLMADKDFNQPRA